MHNCLCILPAEGRWLRASGNPLAGPSAGSDGPLPLLWYSVGLSYFNEFISDTGVEYKGKARCLAVVLVVGGEQPQGLVQ